MSQCTSCGGFCKKSGCERADYVPPQRTWVGLTDDEIYKAEEGAWYMDEFDKIIYAKNIEAKLKGKNT